MAVLLALATPLHPSGSLPAPRFRDIVGVLLCMVTARTAAMAFNRFVDRHIDAANPRTANRHLPSGELTPAQVAVFTLISSIAFLASTLLFLPNWLPIAGAIPVLFWLLGYSLAKRFTAASQIWLGVALALSPICGWVAIRGPQDGQWIADLGIPAWLAASVALWVAGFDSIYACQDFEFDKRAGLHSIPSRFGVGGALRISAGLHVAMLATLGIFIAVGRTSGLGIPMMVVWVAVAAMVIRQHWLVSETDLSRVGIAFFNVNATISVLLFVGVVVDVLVF